MRGPESLCMSVFYLASSRRVRKLLPAPLEVLEVAPGATLCGYYAAGYERGGARVSEFAFLQGYASYSGRRGFYISRFYMDRSRAVEGCDPGDFEWDTEGKSFSVTVRSGGVHIITLRLRPLLRDVPVNANFPLLRLKGENVIFYQNNLIRKAGVSASSVIIPPGSPLKDARPGIKLVSAFWDTTKIIVREPEFALNRALKATDFGAPLGRGARDGLTFDAREPELCLTGKRGE